MTDPTIVPAPAIDPIWWHRIVLDALSPRATIGLLLVILNGLMMWALWNSAVPRENQTMFAQAQGALLTGSGALFGWLWSKGATEAMKDKAIADLAAKSADSSGTGTGGASK